MLTKMFAPHRALVSAKEQLRAFEERIAKVSSQLTKLEGRAERTDARLEELEHRATIADPGLRHLMRDGLPLEYFTRLKLAERGYEVKGTYFYKFHNEDTASWIERSVDVLASRLSRFVVPETQGTRRAGESWPECVHLLVEVKQRKAGVQWIFVSLPRAGHQGTFAADGVPTTTAGFEVRPGKEADTQSTANAKDVKNAISQLQYAFIPLTIDVERERKTSRQEDVRDSVRLVLVTNAKLFVFNPPTDFESLNRSASHGEFLKEVDWLVCRPETSLHLRLHQRACVQETVLDDLRLARGLSHITMPELLAGHSEQIDVVTFSHLDKYLDFVADPPRIRSIQISFSIDGAPPGPPVRIGPETGD
jgi:hypothetical protein